MEEDERIMLERIEEKTEGLEDRIDDVNHNVSTLADSIEHRMDRQHKEIQANDNRSRRNQLQNKVERFAVATVLTAFVGAVVTGIIPL